MFVLNFYKIKYHKFEKFEISKIKNIIKLIFFKKFLIN